MKVITYNTLFGGLDGLDQSRFEAQVQFINDNRPDILIVQEAKGATENGNRRLFEMERAFNMRGFIAYAPHTGQNTGIFIRQPIEPLSFESDSIHFHHALSILKLQIPSFDKPVTVMSAHLCPFGTPVRLIEASYLVNYAEANQYVLLAGDFNSVSPHDEDPVGLETLPSHYRARYMAENGKTVDKRTLETLYSAGFIDIGNQFHKNGVPTVPTVAYKDSEFVPFRSDYILATQALAARAISYGVVKTSVTDLASDHYPLLSEFE